MNWDIVRHIFAECGGEAQPVEHLVGIRDARQGRSPLPADHIPKPPLQDTVGREQNRCPHQHMAVDDRHSIRIV